MGPQNYAAAEGEFLREKLAELSITTRRSFLERGIVPELHQLSHGCDTASSKGAHTLHTYLGNSLASSNRWMLVSQSFFTQSRHVESSLHNGGAHRVVDRFKVT